MVRRAGQLSALVSMSALLTAIGCSPYMQYPSLYHPGTAQQQRAEAVVHDPYPLDDAGPPVVGGRPSAFLTTVPEVKRSREFWDKLLSAGRAPVSAPAPTIQPPAVPIGPPVPLQPSPQVTTPSPLGYTPALQGYIPAQQGYVQTPSLQPPTTPPTPPRFRY